LVVTAGSVGSEKVFLKMFVDVLPVSSSPNALANSTKVCLYLYRTTIHIRISDSKAVN